MYSQQRKGRAYLKIEGRLLDEPRPLDSIATKGVSNRGSSQ